MHSLTLKLSRQKIKKAFKKAGAGNVKINPGGKVSYTCPEESSRYDWDYQRPTKDFARRLYNALTEVGYEVKGYIYCGEKYFQTWRIKELDKSKEL